MKATVTLQTAGTIPDKTIYIKGDGPGELDFAAVPETLSGGSVSVTLQSTALPDRVDYLDSAEFQVSWWYADSAAGPWHEAGTSANQLYVTLDTPITSSTTAPPLERPVYHSLIHLGCESAASVKAATQQQVFDSIWQRFVDGQITSKDGIPLTYYGEDMNSLGRQSTVDLLKYHDGACGAWAKFFLDVCYIQGLDYRNSHGYNYVILVPAYALDDGFMVANWIFPSSPGANANYSSTYDSLNIGQSPFYIHQGIMRYNWFYADVTEANGLSGQGKSNPVSLFTAHHILRINGQYYDPSYGKTYMFLEDMVTQALDGFYIFHSTGYLVDEPAIHKDLNGNGQQNDLQVPTDWVYLFRDTVDLLPLPGIKHRDELGELNY